MKYVKSPKNIRLDNEREEEKMIVIMPRIGMTMQDATIIKWFYGDGDKTVKGEPMLEIETEKITNTIDAPAEGIIHIKAQEGEVIECGEEIAEIVE